MDSSLVLPYELWHATIEKQVEYLVSKNLSDAYIEAYLYGRLKYKYNMREINKVINLVRNNCNKTAVTNV